jgi:hypothetical protein
MQTVQLRSYRFRHEGDIDLAVLDSVGIRCVLVGDDAGGLGAHIMSANPIRLLVAEDDVVAAEEALAEYDAEDSDAEEADAPERGASS